MDGESFPSHVGTGTEDYYNFSWAPEPSFQTPFANEVRIDQPETQGYNVVTRTRNLDGIPFTTSLAFDIEIMPWKETRLTYAATTYWYGAPGATCNRAPMPEEAVRPLQALPAPTRIPGAVECETMELTAKSPGTATESQDIAAMAAGTWSAGHVLLVRGQKAGDFVLRAEASGANPASRPPRFYFGLDCVVVTEP